MWPNFVRRRTKFGKIKFARNILSTNLHFPVSEFQWSFGLNTCQPEYFNDTLALFFYRQGLAYYTRKFAVYKVISYLTSLWEWTFARAIAFQILSNENKLLKASAKLSYIYIKLTKPIWNLNTVCIYIRRLNHQQQCDKHICTSFMAPSNLP